MAENAGEKDTRQRTAAEPTMTAAIREEELVARVVLDANRPPDLLLFWGYGGISPAEGHARLYLDANCATFVDIPRDAIVHTVAVPKAQSPLGGSYVWVAKEHWARLKWGSSTSIRQEAAQSPLEWYRQRKAP